MQGLVRNDYLFCVKHWMSEKNEPRVCPPVFAADGLEPGLLPPALLYALVDNCKTPVN